MDTTTTKFRPAGLIDFTPGHIAHTAIINLEGGAVLLLAIDAGAVLPTHTAPADVLIQVLEGTMDFHREDQVIPMAAGDFVTMTPGTHHSLHALTPLKVLVTKINVK